MLITWRRALISGLVAVCLAAGVFALRGPILARASRFLIVQDPVRQSDIIFLHTGDVPIRPPVAATLLQQGFGRRIIIARSESPLHVQMGLVPNSTDLSIGVLLKCGVPAEQIVQLSLPGGVTSTYDEARVLRDYVRANGIRSVIVVTTAIHTRRSSWILRKVLRDTPVTLIMYPVPDRRYTESNWWTNETGVTGHFNLETAVGPRA